VSEPAAQLLRRDAGCGEHTKPNIHCELAATLLCHNIPAAALVGRLSHLFPNAAVSGTETTALQCSQWIDATLWC